MATAVQSRLIDFDEFCRIVKDGEKADLIDGVIYMASPENTAANLTYVWLSSLMFNFAQIKDLGRITGTRVAFRLTAHRSPEPDIGFVRKSRMHLIKRGYVNGAPDLAVELVSPDSMERDYETKRDLYEHAGVKEYWIIDDLHQQVTLLRLGRTGQYREVKPKDGVMKSRAMKGFWLKIDWLWQEPLPMQIDVLKEILAGCP